MSKLKNFFLILSVISLFFIDKAMGFASGKFPDLSQIVGLLPINSII